MKVKNEYQKFFRDERFTHHITLPPSNLNEKSVLPVLRQIEFKLNKSYLKSSFPKYAETDRFRFFIFPEDKNLNLQHFHVLLFSPFNRDKSYNKDSCIACKVREEPFYNTCPHCTTRTLYKLIEEHLPQLENVQVSITAEHNYADNIYATKKQKFSYEYADSYLVC